MGKPVGPARANAEDDQCEIQSPFVSLRRDDPSWDYRGAFTKHLTHGLHSYPAMMIPQVARRLIEGYSRPGDTILDPFCGSGSVLVEARVLGRNAWGIDLNPLALLVARAKTTPLDPARLDAEYQALLRRVDGLPAGTVPLPAFYNRDYWFKPAVIDQLARIKRAIEGVDPDQPALETFFLVAFSETVRLASNSRSHEFKLFRYSPQTLASHNPDALAIFREKTERNLARLRDLSLACADRVAPWCRTLLADSRQPIEAIPPESVDLVVTSPPYGDSRTTVAYGQFSRLSAQWLGFDDLATRRLDNNLLGGRSAGGGRTPVPASPSLAHAVSRIGAVDPLRARQALGFYLDLEKALGEVSHTVRPGGHLCVVIGNRRVRKVQIPTDLIVAELAAGIGLRPQQIVVRNIPQKTMPLQNSPTNVPGQRELTMHQEYIVILHKPQGSGSTLVPSPFQGEG